MAAPTTKGRMINRAISDSKGFASLSPEAAVLFCMMIPNFNSHGKMNGAPGYVKAEVCPRVPYLTERNLPKLLEEITEKTSVKWFENDGRRWIHSTNFLSEHQALSPAKLGSDLLPTYSGVSPELVRHEVEVEVEVEEKTTPLPPASGGKRVKRSDSFPEPVQKLIAYYEREIVRIPAKRHDAMKNIASLLKAGFDEASLASAAVGYAQECIDRDTAEDRRYHANNFFGQKGYFRGYLPVKEAANG